MLPLDQVDEIKKQLITQIESTFPEDKKQSAIQQIESMDIKQLEQFLIQNNLMKTEEGNPPASQSQQCIFCSIVFGDTSSYKIDENKDSIAILELNPISKGHSLIIPKEHITSSDKIPKTAFTLAKKIAKKMKTKFKSKDVRIASANILGHEIINVFPIYDEETINSPRTQATPEDLRKLQKRLEVKRKPKTIKKQVIKKKTKPKTKSQTKEKKLWLPKRIP